MKLNKNSQLVPRRGQKQTMIINKRGYRLGDQVAAIAAAARAAGEAEGFDTGFHHALNQGHIFQGPHYEKPREAEYEAELAKFEQIEFPILKTVNDCNQYADPAGALRYFIEESDRLGAEARKKAEREARGEGTS